jgi:DnaA family protein
MGEPLPQQLPLRFAFIAEHDFEEFHPGGNAETVSHLRRCAEGAGEALIFLWGAEGQGKTHLLHACCRKAHQSGQAVSYVPLQALRDYGESVLDDLEHQHLICLDDLHCLAGVEAWEHAIFRLFNRVREMNHRLIISARIPPAELPIRLPDLKTRLGWGLTLMLRPLSDEDKLAALSLHAQTLGWELPLQVGRFLLSHHRRDLAGLCCLLEELDHATLAAKRKLTIPFLKTYLGKST